MIIGAKNSFYISHSIFLFFSLMDLKKWKKNIGKKISEDFRNKKIKIKSKNIVM